VVPVALFVYNRANVLERTLACLRGAGLDTLHVFSDGPRNDEDAAGVERVRELVRGIRWADTTIHERPANLGLSASIVSGVSEVLETHERVIVVEDDVWVAPEFGRFVAAALSAYAHDERVVGVTGLRLPFSRRALRGYPYDAFLLPRFSSWGWATWRRAWRTLELDVERLAQRVRDSGARLDVAGHDVPEMWRRVVSGELRGAWDVRCCVSMVANGQLIVTPVWNMVENGGLESGTHFRKPPPFTLRWETERRRDVDALRFPPSPSARAAWAVRRFTLPADRRLGRRLDELLRRSARLVLSRGRQGR
jgi:hypothetical protein